MSKQIIMIVFAAMLGMLVTVLIMDHPTARAAGGGGGGQYEVVASQAGFVLVDTGSSMSWVMPPPSDRERRFAWFPVERLDTQQKVQIWRAGGKAEDPK